MPLCLHPVWGKSMCWSHVGRTKSWYNSIFKFSDQLATYSYLEKYFEWLAETPSQLRSSDIVCLSDLKATLATSLFSNENSRYKHLVPACGSRKPHILLYGYLVSEQIREINEASYNPRELFHKMGMRHNNCMPMMASFCAVSNNSTITIEIALCDLDKSARLKKLHEFFEKKLRYPGVSDSH